MGLFDIFKSSAEGTKSIDVDRELLNYLKQVDELYMKSYSLKSTRDISKYLTRECAGRLSSSVCSVNVRYFGETKYRTTVWINENIKDKSLISIRKEVAFDNLKIAGKLAIAIASDYTERWIIKIEPKDSFVVDRIQQLE